MGKDGYGQFHEPSFFQSELPGDESVLYLEIIKDLTGASGCLHPVRNGDKYEKKETFDLFYLCMHPGMFCDPGNTAGLRSETSGSEGEGRPAGQCKGKSRSAERSQHPRPFLVSPVCEPESICLYEKELADQCRASGHVYRRIQWLLHRGQGQSQSPGKEN